MRLLLAIILTIATPTVLFASFLCLIRMYGSKGDNPGFGEDENSVPETLRKRGEG